MATASPRIRFPWRRLLLDVRGPTIQTDPFSLPGIGTVQLTWLAQLRGGGWLLVRNELDAASFRWRAHDRLIIPQRLLRPAGEAFPVSRRRARQWFTDQGLALPASLARRPPGRPLDRPASTPAAPLVSWALDGALLLDGDLARDHGGEPVRPTPSLRRAVEALALNLQAGGQGLTRVELEKASGSQDARRRLQELARACPRFGELLQSSPGKRGWPARYRLRRLP